METIATWTAAWAKIQNLEHELQPELSSTNSWSKEAFYLQKYLLLTEHQSAGRGRGTNEWVDIQPGSTLLSSWCFPLQKAVQPIASPLVGLCLHRAAVKAWPHLQWSLKAPNDLYLKNKKIAGLLLENVTAGHQHLFIVGLGVNVRSHPEVDRAGHLEEFTKSNTTKEQWFQFLDVWWHELQQTIPETFHTTLTPDHCRQILSALNHSPMLIAKYDKVLPDGSLVQDGITRPWMEI
jgi:BirA family biotin operon repressor/biotin-[acetyl-CoA-carboxylase] ligase